VSSPTYAASHSGRLQIKGPGSVYSGPGALVAEAVGAGTTDQFQLQVVNTGSELAQYNIKLLRVGLPANSGLYTGSLALTPLAAGPDGYYTAQIAPGKSQSFTLKVEVPSGTPQGSIDNYVVLYATDGTQLGYDIAQTEIKAPTYGATAADVFAKQGSQPYVGGSVNGQITSSPATSVGGSATYTVKLQNNGPVPAAVFGRLSTWLDCSTIVVKDGTVDVTAALLNGTYATPVLAVHAAKTLSVTMKPTMAAGSCGAYDFVDFSARNAGNTVSHEVSLFMSFPAG
jgi:hypothetical protein